MMLKLKPAALATLVMLSTLSAGVHASTATIGQSEGPVFVGGGQDGRKTYIVQLKAEPAASYKGGVAGYAPTQAASGTRFSFDSAAVQAYVGYLDGVQSSVVSTVADAPVLYRYKVVFNGFSARLTDEQAISLKQNPAVADVQEERVLQLDTISTTNFLKLTAPGGLWSQSQGGFAIKGENMVAGIVDGGIWPENPAFADRVDINGKPTFNPAGTLAFGPKPATFLGGCVAGEGFAPLTHCNNKLIGAKFFNAGFLAYQASTLASTNPATTHWSDFASPRDSVGGASGKGGHGDHTASTAAGNAGATAIVNGLALGEASGMAPRARVASYKVCWTYNDTTTTDGSGNRNSCFQTDTIAAIDAAVADGVNVINYSISGSQTSSADGVEQAFYRASLAGVFVAASAGNSGPGNAVAHISPWLSTVGASTHDRNFQADATLGNGAKYFGASQNQVNLAQTALVRAEDVGVGGGNANLCYSVGATGGQVLLDPVKVNGKVVICTRGGNARVDKSLAVLNAGGVGMILADNGGGLVAEAHSVPSVHVSATDGTTIKAYALANAPPGATSAISAFYAGTKPAPLMAGFSSRGPNQGDSNILKPDMTAPGVDIIASVTPALTNAQRDQVVAGTLVPGPAWASYQGTSMSSPHVAGIALLVKQLRPTWSPAAIKSALMTSAYSTLDDGQAGQANGLLPWAQGAGHIDPNKAAATTLVYDAGQADYFSYQCKVNPALVTGCTAGTTLGETYNLNLPSITVGNVLGTVTVNRRVTNVGASSATYAGAASLPGFTTVVTPASLTLAAGATGSFTVRLTTNGAAENVWQFGALTWTNGAEAVRSPIQARTGKPVSAPAQLTSGNTQAGSRLFGIRTGFAGRITTNRGGLSDVTMSPSAALVAGAKTSAQLMTACQAGVDLPDVKVYTFAVPATAIVARFALRQADVNGATDDNDLGVLAPDGTTWSYSGNDGSNEAVQLSAPVAGNYKVCVAAWGGGASMTHSLSSWLVNTGDTGGSMAVMTPTTVYAGGASTIGVSWRGLPLGGRYLGGVQFKDTAGVVQATTVLRVETNGGLPVTEAPDTVAAKVVQQAE